MVTRDEVPHDARLPESIIVTVDEIRTNPKPRRDTELDVRDEDGARLTVVIWETHEIDQPWEMGATYVLSGMRGKRYPAEDGTKVEVQSTKAFSAKRLSANDETSVLVLGDTHVGYRHRSKMAKWARDINPREIFIQCLERAKEMNVDAVIHAGDVFDDHNTNDDRDAVSQAIVNLDGDGIPFYYVLGNHDSEHGRRLLESTPAIHLGQLASLIGMPPVNVLGVDHCGASFPQHATDTSVDSVSNETILVIHESPHPVIGDNGKLLYQHDSNKADILSYIDSVPAKIDLIITGHLHVADRVRVQGRDTPVLVTGPTIPISKYKKHSNPSTWLLTATDTGIHLDRQPV